MKPISDLACELLRRKPADLNGIQITTQKKFGITTHTTTITTAQAAKHIGKPVGTYLNIQATPTTHDKHLSQTLAQALNTQVNNGTKILVVGLGNDQFIADSLGPQVLENIQTGDTLLTFQPSVFGVTGINSVDAIKAITDLTKPTTVIIIDSLVSASPERIGTNYQICTSGITPGSGLGRNNQKIDQQFLGVPVLALGIPVCTIMTTKKQIYHVVPKDIDDLINHCATIIATAINTLAWHRRYDATKPWLSDAYQRYSSFYLLAVHWVLCLGFGPEFLRFPFWQLSPYPPSRRRQR